MMKSKNVKNAEIKCMDSDGINDFVLCVLTVLIHRFEK